MVINKILSELVKESIFSRKMCVKDKTQYYKLALDFYTLPTL